MRKYKIVIVENDEDELHFMNEGFESAGLFEILSLQKNGNALFDWMERNKANLPEIILSDLNMPGKNGYDILNEVKTNPVYAHIPVIITSTSSTKSIIDKCLSLGAADYLVKPDTFINYSPYVKNLYDLIGEKRIVSN